MSGKWYVARYLVTFPCPKLVTLKCLPHRVGAREYDDAPNGRCAREAGVDNESEY